MLPVSEAIVGRVLERNIRNLVLDILSLGYLLKIQAETSNRQLFILV